MKILEKFLILLCLFPLLKAKDLPLFLQNKGQWHESIQYRAQLKSAEWLLQENAFSFLLIDYRKVHQYCDHHHENSSCNHESEYGLRASQKPIELPFQFFQQNFINSLKPTFKEEFPSETKFNFYQGNDPKYWRSGIRAFASITYENFYQGIDMKVHTTNNELHYDWIIHPGANPNHIQWAYSGLEPELTKDGLQIKLDYITFTEKKPVAWQIIDGKKVFVPVSFKKSGKTYSFQLGNYHPHYELVIDPVLIFSTLTGSLADNWGFTATYDIYGNAYSGGNVNGAGFPTTSTSFQANFQGGFNNFPSTNSLFYSSDMAIIKYNATGTQRLYATYIGGSLNEQPHSMITDDKGNLYILGATSSSNFPVTSNAFQNNFGGNIDAVVVVLDSAGSNLKGSTFVGGSGLDGVNNYLNNSQLYYYYADDARGEIQLDNDGNVLIGTCTRSFNLPITGNAFQTNLQGIQDGLIAKFSPDLSTCYYLSYFGGNGNDAIYGITKNDSGLIYISGGTTSNNLPTTPNSINPAYMGGIADGFVFLLDTNFQVLSGTYIGTNQYDQTYLIHLDKNSNVYVTGQTSGNYPVTGGVYSIPNGGQFVTKISPDLSQILYSTRFGKGDGNPELGITALLVDKCENVYVAGWGGSVASNVSGNGESVAGMVTTPGAFQTTSPNGSDFYFIVFQKNATALAYATYFGGNVADEHVDGGTSRYDVNGVVYQSVCANCGGLQNFPVTPGAFSTVNGSSNCNNGLFKFDFLVSNAVVAQFNFNSSSLCTPAAVSLNNLSLNSTSVLWDFGDGTTSTSFNPPPHIYSQPGQYEITLIVNNPNSCNISDTIKKVFTVYEKVTPAFTDTCGLVQSFQSLNVAQSYLWDFGDGNISTLANPTHTYADSGTYSVRLITNPGTPCADTLVKQVRAYHKGNAQFSDNFLPCNLNVQFYNNNPYNQSYLWDFGNGNTSTQPNPTFTFPDTGQYTVRLIVNGNDPCLADTFVKTYHFVPKTFANFSASVNCDSSVAIINLSQYATAYFWDFGNGQTDTTMVPIYQYPDTGNYVITLITQPGTHCADTFSVPIRISPQPKAIPVYNPVSCIKNQIFTHQSLNNQQVQWAFSDGAIYHSDTVNHTFADTGVYTIRLIAMNNGNCDDTLDFSVYISPVSIANANVDFFLCDTFVVLNNNSQFANNYLWIMGDGSTFTTPNVSYHYSDTGTYTILLITQPFTDCADTFTTTVQFLPKPTANFSVQQEICVRTVNLLNSSQLSQQYLWFVEDSVYISPNVTHTFSQYGDFSVRLIAIADNSCSDTVTQIVSIVPPGQAIANYSRRNCSPRVNFENQSIGAFSYWWDFGDGNTSNLPNPTHNYSAHGDYIIRFIINQGTACVDSLMDTITILNPSTPNIFIEQEACTGELRFYTNLTNFRSIVWDFGDGTTSTQSQPIYFYGENKSGNYLVQVTVVDTNGCVVQSDTLYRFIPSATSYIFIPNVFTPNGDGLNDTFKISGQFPECVESVLIFDRWGNLIFSSDNYANAWDGTYKNGAAPEGAYVYVVSGKRFKRFGTVTLIR